MKRQRKGTPAGQPAIPSIDEHTAAVFADVVKFRIDAYRGNSAKLWRSGNTADFNQALLVASRLVVDNNRVLLYAIDSGGQVVLLPQSQWARFRELWEKKQNVGNAE